MITGNEPSTPTLMYNHDNLQPWGFEPGLTIRQHFASMAMQGFLSDFKCIQKINNASEPYLTTSQAIAKEACELADALIAELNKK